MLLMGPPKAGKSFLAWDLATAVATGTPFMGYACEQPSKVLYLQLDTKEAAWTERLNNFAKEGVNLDIPNLRLVHQEDMLLPLLITTDKGKAFVRSLMATVDPALVIMDVLREVHAEDENDSTVMKNVFDAMEPLFTGRTLLLVHHSRKMTPDDDKAPNINNLARGSSYVTGRVDGTFLLYGDGPNRKLIFESRFQETISCCARQNPDTGLFTFPDLVPDATLVQNLLKLCQENPKKTHSQLAKVAAVQYGLNRTTYYRLIYGQKCAHRQLSPPLATSGVAPYPQNTAP